MSRTLREALGILVLALGLAMLVVGSRAFSAKPQPKAPVADVEDGVADLSHDVIGSPTTGEMLRGLVTGPVGRKMGALVIACLGLAVASGAGLSLVPKRRES
jgi:type IV secretory pathway VirB2 component (pilin)